MKKLLGHLQELGLTETQASIYAALNKLKKATVLQIARETNLQRPTIYENAEILATLGLISQTIIKSKKFLTPEDPSKLYELIEKKGALAKETVEEIRLISADSPARKDFVRVFSGAEGAKRLTDFILEAKQKEIRAIGSYEEIIAKLWTQDFNIKLWEARKRRNIHTRVMFTESDRPMLEKHPDYTVIGNIKYDRKVRILPAKINFKVFYNVVDDRVLFWSSKEDDFFSVFESPSYAASIRTLFDYLWEQSTPFNS